MRELQNNEAMQVQGATLTGTLLPYARFLLPVVINSGIHVFLKYMHDEELTPTGLSIAASTGVVTSAVGSFIISSSACDINTAFAWVPGIAALNVAGNLIANEF